MKSKRLSTNLTLFVSMFFALYSGTVYTNETRIDNYDMTREVADFMGLTSKTLFVENLEKLSSNQIIELGVNAKSDNDLIDSIAKSLTDRDPKETVEIIESILPHLRHQYQISYFIEPYGRALAETTKPDDNGTTTKALLKLHYDKRNSWDENIGMKQFWDRIISIAIQRSAYREKIHPEKVRDVNDLKSRNDDTEHIRKLKESVMSNYNSSFQKWDMENELKDKDASFPLQSEIDDPARVPAWLAKRATDTPISEPERKRLLKFLQSVDRANFNAHQDKIRTLLMSDQMEDHFNHLYENARLYVLAHFDLTFPQSSGDVPALLDSLVQNRLTITTDFVGTYYRPSSHGEITTDKFIAAGLARTLELAVEKYPEESIRWLKAADLGSMTEEQKLYLLEGFHWGLKMPWNEPMQKDAREYLDQFVTIPTPQHN